MPGDGYKYKYNGKEHEDNFGLNIYEMDLRQYDPAIARWVVQDPVIHHEFSPYSAFDNNPAYWSDPSGADAAGYTLGGKFVGASFTGQDAIDAYLQLAGESSASGVFEALIQDIYELSDGDSGISFSGGGGEGNGNGGGNGNNISLSKSEQMAIGLRYYGGDYSGSAHDYTLSLLDLINEYNPIANIWDGISGSINGTDRLGNPLTDFETGLKYASAVPIGKITNIGVKSLSAVELNILRKGISTTLSNSNNIRHIMDSKHKLDSILKIAGSERNVVRRLYLSLGQQSSLPASGTFERVINIYSKQVTIRGAVVNGIPRIATAFIP